MLWQRYWLYIHTVYCHANEMVQRCKCMEIHYTYNSVTLHTILYRINNSHTCISHYIILFLCYFSNIPLHIKECLQVSGSTTAYSMWKKSCIKPLASPERAVRSHQVMSLESESVGCKPVGVELNRSLLQAPCLRLRLAAPGYIRH